MSIQPVPPAGILSNLAPIMALILRRHGIENPSVRMDDQLEMPRLIIRIPMKGYDEFIFIKYIRNERGYVLFGRNNRRLTPTGSAESIIQTVQRLRRIIFRYRVTQYWDQKGKSAWMATKGMEVIRKYIQRQNWQWVRATVEEIHGMDFISVVVSDTHVHDMYRLRFEPSRSGFCVEEGGLGPSRSVQSPLRALARLRQKINDVNALRQSRIGST